MSVLRLVPTKGEATVVDADEALVGREASCNVVVSHPSVSRRHALLKRKQSVFFVVDQGSANGTFVDSKRIVDAALKEGSVLRFGSAAFRVEIREDAPAEPMAEDELGIETTMVGQTPAFSDTVHEVAPEDEIPYPDEAGVAKEETPPPTLVSPPSKPRPVSGPRSAPVMAQPVRAATVLPQPHPAPGVPARGPAFWLMIAAGALALLLVGAALGLGAAFVARRLGWL